MLKLSRILSLAFICSLVVLTGCASKKQTTKQINALHAQVGVITDELVRLDQELQSVRSGSRGVQGVSAESSYQTIEEEASSYQGGMYRTPSGFELPSMSIQKALKNAGYYQGALDGKIGPGTRDAVRAFQRDNGLKADGIVGRGTWEKLKAYSGEVIK